MQFLRKCIKYMSKILGILLIWQYHHRINIGYIILDSAEHNDTQ